MPITLPILDTSVDDALPNYRPGQESLTQQILEKVMQRDFPGVAALGLAAYAARLMRVEYTEGTTVFYLDWTPELPGYTVCLLEPWTTRINGGSGMTTHITYYSGPVAASKAEAIRRRIAPEQS